MVPYGETFVVCRQSFQSIVTAVSSGLRRSGVKALTRDAKHPSGGVILEGWGTANVKVETSLPLLGVGSCVQLRIDSNRHLLLIVRTVPSSCAVNILRNVKCLLGAVVLAATGDPKLSQLMMVTYAIRLDSYPCLPFASQLDGDSSTAQLQRVLRADNRFAIWSVPTSREASEFLASPFLVTNNAIFCDDNDYGLDGLTTAQHILAFGRCSKQSRKVNLRIFSDE